MMKFTTIKIDSELDNYLENKSKNLDETRNMTIKRLLKIEQKQSGLAPVEKQENKRKRKRPKVSIPILIENGYLKKGETLFFLDYQRKNTLNHEAVLTGDKVQFEGIDYSMSALAKKLLKAEGHTSPAVAGPRHWCNKDGISISTLWKKYLSNISK